MPAKCSSVCLVEILETGKVIINIAKAEMGQHVGTALARVVADELREVGDKLAHVDTDPRWGYMVTGGSWSVVTGFNMMSQAGAAGRSVLLEAAATLMGVDASELAARDSVISGGGQSISFADVVRRGDVSRTFSDEELAGMPIKGPDERVLIGTASDAKDIPAKAGGGAVYGLDAELPGMVYATPEFRHAMAARPTVDDSAAKKVPGYLRF